MPKKILLVIASDGFQPIEYYGAKAALERAGQKIITASDGAGEALAAYDGTPAKIDINIFDAKAADFDGVFLIGGPGAMEHLDNDIVYKLVREAEAGGKLWGAVCVAPRILANAGLLKGKKVTGWDGDDMLDKIFTGAGAEYIKEPVVADGRLITATGPKVAEDWGGKIANLCL